MKILVTALAATLLTLGAASTAQARVNVDVGIYPFGYVAPPPAVVYQPAPYYAPPPVVYGGGGYWGGGWHDRYWREHDRHWRDRDHRGWHR